jgi:glycosyltransferase involved in cell wall biosynthesis
MKILFINDEDVIGRRFNGYNIANYLIDNGHDARMLVWNSSTKQPSPFVSKFADLHYLKQLTKARNAETVLSWQALIEPWMISEYPDLDKYDLVHIHIIYPYNINLFDLSRLARIKPVVISLHDFWFFYGHCIHKKRGCSCENGCNCCHEKDRLFSIREDKSSLLAKAKSEILGSLRMTYVVSNDWFKDKLQKMPGLMNSDMNVLPFGLNLEIFKPKDKSAARTALGIDPESTVIAFRNSISNPMKDDILIMKALGDSKLKGKPVLLTMGYVGGYERLEKNFKIVELGVVSDEEMMSLFYNAADLFLMISKHETFGMMAIEAAACGIPSIVTDDTPLPIIANAPESSIVIPQDDAKALVNAIDLLTSNPERRISMGRLAHAFAEKRYGEDLYYKGMLKIYDNAMIMFNKNYGIVNQYTKASAR